LGIPVYTAPAPAPALIPPPVPLPVAPVAAPIIVAAPRLDREENRDIDLQDEQNRKLFEKILNFQKDKSKNEMNFDRTLSSYHRRQVHIMAEKIGLEHLSSGPETNRIITIKKKLIKPEAVTTTTTTSSVDDKLVNGIVNMGFPKAIAEHCLKQLRDNKALANEETLLDAVLRHQLKANTTVLTGVVTTTTVASVEQEKEKEKELNECKVCFENEIDCLLLPCSHLAICSDCAGELKKCPICNSAISKSQKIYRA